VIAMGRDDLPPGNDRLENDDVPHANSDKGAGHVVDTEDNWRAEIRRTKDGAIRSTVANAITFLRFDPRWRPVLAYNELAEKIVTLQPPPWHEHDAARATVAGYWTEEDTTRTVAWFQRELDVTFKPGTTLEAVATVARACAFNPAADYLSTVKWDGTPRLSTSLKHAHALVSHFGARDTLYAREVFTRWMISAVARARNPGCKVDCVLILEGDQGIRKSEGIRALCPNVDWFFDSDIEFGSKAAAEVIRGAWIIELAELQSILRARSSHGPKAFLSRRVDAFRPSYGRTTQVFPRRCVFAGSTNDTEYLSDPSGARRFWPVHVVAVDVAAIERDRDQVWAEAVIRFEDGDRWYADTPELAALCADEQEQRYTADPWELTIGRYLAAKAPSDQQTRGDHPDGVLVADLLVRALGVERGKQGRTDEQRVAAVLRRLDFVKGKQRRRDGVRVRPWYPKDSPLLDRDPPDRAPGDSAGDDPGDDAFTTNSRGSA